MGTQEKPKDVWGYATELVRRVLPHVPFQGLTQGLTFGEFQYYGSSSERNFHIHRGEIESIVCFYPSVIGMRIPEHFCELVYWEKGIRYALLSNAIKLNDQNYGTYPSFHYEWSGGKSNPEDKGKLVSLRVDLAGDTFVSYEGSNLHSNKSGKPELLTQLPDTLIGVDELLGVGIPWVIDYYERSLGILSKIGLEEFVIEVEKTKVHS